MDATVGSLISCLLSSRYTDTKKGLYRYHFSHIGPGVSCWSFSRVLLTQIIQLQVSINNKKLFYISFFFVCILSLSAYSLIGQLAVGSLKKPRSSGDENGFSKYFPFVAMHAHHCCETRFVPEWKTKIAPGFFFEEFCSQNKCLRDE